MTPTILIEAKTKTISMGGTAILTAQVQSTGERLSEQLPEQLLLLPFVNGRRWGAHERVDAQGRAAFLLPLPNPGPAVIQVVGLPLDPDHWMGLGEAGSLAGKTSAAGRNSATDDLDLLMVGRSLPEHGVFSNTIQLEVTRKTYPERKPGETLFCMQWEPWFCWGIRSWQTAQAVPLVGFYEAYNRDVLRQHFLWMIELGVDFILPDWTNHIWKCKHWDERSDGVNAIVHVTTLALETLAEMKAEGLPVPKVALFPGLSNGYPATMEALNEQLNWIYHTYLRNPRFAGLWQEYEGKPLMVVLDTGAVGDKRGKAASAFRIPFFKQTLEMSEAELDAFRAAQGPVDDRYTVRWMSSQNDTTRHHELGYWSWMDGSIDPPVTWYQDKADAADSATAESAASAVAEAVTVSVGFFGAQGWKHPSARGRRAGSTLLETFQTALKHRPRFVFLHQFNEFTGQPEGHGYGPDKSIFVDTYSVELSDDFEPVSLTAPGSRFDKGGWGFFYLNLARALIDIYRGLDEDSSILTVSSPLANQEAGGANALDVAWAWVGKPVSGVKILLDDVVQGEFTSSPAKISMEGVQPGKHEITLLGLGAATRYPLSMTTLDEPLEEPIPVQVTVPFIKMGKPSQ
jgi:hypothetical protein